MVATTTDFILIRLSVYCVFCGLRFHIMMNPAADTNN